MYALTHSLFCTRACRRGRVRHAHWRTPSRARRAAASSCIATPSRRSCNAYGNMRASPSATPPWASCAPHTMHASGGC
eukprot:1808423-Pyramimonas_sp.AAC.1